MQLDTGSADPLLLDWVQGLQLKRRIHSTALIQRRQAETKVQSTCGVWTLYWKIADLRTESGSQITNDCGRGRGSLVAVCGQTRAENYRIRTPLATGVYVRYFSGSVHHPLLKSKQIMLRNSTVMLYVMNL